jgi:hypothetical protein
MGLNHQGTKMIIVLNHEEHEAHKEHEDCYGSSRGKRDKVGGSTGPYSRRITHPGDFSEMEDGVRWRWVSGRKGAGESFDRRCGSGQ